MSGLFYGSQGKFTWRMCATVLVGQSVVIFFGALVARAVGATQADAGSTSYLIVGSVLAVLALVGAGLMRRPYGVTWGWAVQVATFAAGVVVPAMVAVGVIFTALWLTCLVQGHRIDAPPPSQA